MPKEGETNHSGLGMREGLFSTEYRTFKPDFGWKRK